MIHMLLCKVIIGNDDELMTGRCHQTEHHALYVSPGRLQVMLSAVARSHHHQVCPGDALEVCLEKWINLGDDREIVHMWVDGRPVKHHRLS